MVLVKNYETMSKFVKVMPRILHSLHFSGHAVMLYNLLAVFSARQHYMLSALYAIARPFVSPSVRLCVRLSHGWISQKRLKLGSCNFHHRVAQSLSFLCYKFNIEIPTGSPWAGASNKASVGKTSYFLALCVDITKTVRNATKVTTND